MRRRHSRLLRGVCVIKTFDMLCERIKNGRHNAISWHFYYLKPNDWQFYSKSSQVLWRIILCVICSQMTLLNFVQWHSHYLKQNPCCTKKMGLLKTQFYQRLNSVKIDLNSLVCRRDKTHEKMTHFGTWKQDRSFVITDT